MGKKDKKKNTQNPKAAKAAAADAITLQQTGKFTVLDAPGVIQTPPTATPETPSSSTANQDGAQGRRATASDGPRMNTGNLIGGSSFTARDPSPA